LKILTILLINNGIFGLAGPNGSGKSTLVKIISGVVSPTKGKIEHKYFSETIRAEKLHENIGFVSPYLYLYDEFSAEENLKHFSKIRGVEYNSERINLLFKEFNLLKRKNDLLKTYSSGMKQRVKFIFSLLHSPQVLLLDEPTSNLDESGKQVLYKILEEELNNKIIIIASNEGSDLQLCSEIMQLEDYKKN
jgi:heme exporter protein A